MRRAITLVCVLGPAACGADGVLGAPCEVGSDCDDGLMCDLHQGGGSCQQPHAEDEDEFMPVPGGCALETRDDDYALGLAKAGAWANMTFVEATPAPPDRGDNTWVVDVHDQAGNPVEDLAIVVDPFMPDHAHGTTIRCDVTPADVPGRYVLAPVNLFMPGLWEVTLGLEGADGDDAIVFSFCIDP